MQSLFKEANKISGRVKDLRGDRFGRLQVLYPTRNDNSSKIMMWCCKCDCGNITEVLSTSLHRGSTKSCGCYGDEVRWGGYKGLSLTYFNGIKNRATRSNKEFDVTIEYLFDLFEKQHGKCALSGLDIAFARSIRSKEKTASLDRIDSTKGYIEGNVQWVHLDVNKMKMDLEQSRFLELCNIISSNKKEKQNE